MIFYLVPAANGCPPTLVGTQDDANSMARERELKVRGKAMQHDVPTDKAGLMQYINELLADRHSANRKSEAIENAVLDKIEVTTIPMEMPVVAQVAQALRKPAPRLHPSIPTVDMMVDMIDRGDIDARGLSNIAESVAHRFEKIGKELVNA